MTDPIARRCDIALKVVFGLIRPTLVSGLVAALIAAPDTHAVVPLDCGITWTRIGGVTWFQQDCPKQGTPRVPMPTLPPPGPGTPPGPPPP